MGLEGEGGRTVGVNETKGIVRMIVVTTGDDRMIGGGIGIIEVVLVDALLPLGGNVIVVTKGIVDRIVDIIGVLGCGVDTFVGEVEMVDVFVKITVVGVMIFVILTKLLENPPEGVVLFSFIVEMFKEGIRLIDMFWFLDIEGVITEPLEELGEMP